MKPATEEFLYFLLWTADALMQPTWRNLTDSFETWVYRSGLGRRLNELQRQKYLEKNTSPPNGKAVYRLTAAGRLAALAGIDPLARWSRPWDGQWRLVLFDIPEDENRHRVRLRRRLRHLGFGRLQDSVWLSPDPPRAIQTRLAGAPPDANMFLLFEGQPVGGEGNADLVSAAWNFGRIAKQYAYWSRIAAAAPPLPRHHEPDRGAIRAWAAEERAAWEAIVLCDPFLPAPLLPAGYPGRRAWSQRVQLLNAFGSALGGSSESVFRSEHRNARSGPPSPAT